MMSDYMGQSPHGGYRITHHELCFEDCGHWDCMGCCYCPDEYDVATVEILTATQNMEWLAWWFSDQIAQARKQGQQDEQQRIKDALSDAMRPWWGLPPYQAVAEAFAALGGTEKSKR
jgi:hypothetical protein